MPANVCERLLSLGNASPGNTGTLSPKLLVVLAHPDDEILALGGRLEWLPHARFLTVTDGVPLDGADARDHGFSTLAAYGTARRAELAAALRHAGLDPACATQLRLPHHPGISDQAAALSLAAIALALAHHIENFQPEAILTHPYEGGHPDHDACAFAVAAATRLSRTSAPLLEATFYHAGPNGIETGVFLPQDQAGHPSDPGQASTLSAQQASNKRERLACFPSQAQTLALFRCDAERFRIAPAYLFTQPPHPGKLFYEGFPWGMDAHRFCNLAAAASRELRLERRELGLQ